MSETEPTDPLAELRAAAEAIGGDPEERDSAIITAIEALRYLTSPEAEVEIARVLLKPQSHAARARAVLRFIAEKAVTR